VQLVGIPQGVSAGNGNFRPFDTVETKRESRDHTQSIIFERGIWAGMKASCRCEMQLQMCALDYGNLQE
jgi:hypothetical protein